MHAVYTSVVKHLFNPDSPTCQEIYSLEWKCQGNLVCRRISLRLRDFCSACLSVSRETFQIIIILHHRCMCGCLFTFFFLSDGQKPLRWSSVARFRKILRRNFRCTYTSSSSVRRCTHTTWRRPRALLEAAPRHVSPRRALLTEFQLLIQLFRTPAPLVFLLFTVSTDTFSV